MPPNKRIEQMESLLYETEQRNLPTLDRRLSFQERKCLYLTSQGKEIKETANILGLSQRTIKYHRANIIKKFNVANITAAVAYAVQCSSINYMHEIDINYFTNIIYSMPNNVYWLDINCVLRGGNDNLAKQFNLTSGAELKGLTYE